MLYLHFENCNINIKHKTSKVNTDIPHQLGLDTEHFIFYRKKFSVLLMLIVYTTIPAKIFMKFKRLVLNIVISFLEHSKTCQFGLTFKFSGQKRYTNRVYILTQDKSVYNYDKNTFNFQTLKKKTKNPKQIKGILGQVIS